MNLYIDPGTGSMLFTILIGILGVLRYLLKSWMVKIRFFMSGGRKQKAADDEIPLVVFSDDKRYWNIFKSICEELDKKGMDVLYLTASPDDPALENSYEHVKGEFIGKGNKGFAKLNFLKATIVLSTTPGLDVYQWKRSREVKYYVHIPHAASDITLYRMFGIDYYDAILLSGDFQVSQVRELERVRNLPPKELVKVGIPYMDDMLIRLKTDTRPINETRTILLAPSWGPSAILSKYGEKILKALVDTGYHIIVRPHPQSFKSEQALMDKLMQAYPNSQCLEWNRDSDNYDVLKKADILISDFSGVMFDFALVYDKPIIYTDTEFDAGPYDAWWLESSLWTFDILPKLGLKLEADAISDIKNTIDECIENEIYASGRQLARKQCWEHMGEGAVRVADYLVEKYKEIKEQEANMENEEVEQ